MKIPRPPLSLLVWFGLLGAPLAWTSQHLVGVGMTLAACTEGMARKGVPADPWMIAATAAGALVAVLAGASAIAAFRATRGTDEPPQGRMNFLARVGITVTPLFLMIILMSGITAVLFPKCNQS